MIDFPVDIVYTWVDGSDPKWLKKKDDTLNKYSSFHKSEEISGRGRFDTNKELIYSLRSIDKYAPWVRKIFIVTDDQAPTWLNLNHPKIQIVDHVEIFPSTKYLPCFNSNAIEMCLHKIQDLSEHFLSFNDDFFLGRPTLKSDFYHESNKPKLFSSKGSFFKKRYLTIRKENPHQYAILNARKLVFENFNIILNFNLRHAVKTLKKSHLITLEEKFPEYFEITRKHQFRDNSDIWVMALDAYYSVATKNNIPFFIKPYRKDYIKYKFKFIRKNRDYTYIPLSLSESRIKSKFKTIEKYNPLMFCINDGPDGDNLKAKLMIDFLNNFYVDKSEFEL